MTTFHASYEICRGRFDEAVRNLSQPQLNWQIHDHALSIGQSALHVAGVEIWFIEQLTGVEQAELEQLKRCATEGVVDEGPFPYAAGDITPELVNSMLARARALAEPILRHPSEELLRHEIKSALGPMITGHGALARLAFHPGYHHGQAHLIVTASDFPR